MYKESLNDYYSEEPAVSKIGRLRILFFILLFDDTVKSRRSLYQRVMLHVTFRLAGI